MNTTLTLVRRELLEHRSIFFAPGILTLIILAASLFAVAKGLSVGSEVNYALDELRSADPERVRVMLRSLLSVSLIPFAVPFNLLMSAVASFYLLDSLYGERKDRSVLFWRSLPVSDTQSVVAKLLTGLVAVGLVEMVAVIIAFALNGIILSVGLLALGENPITLLWLHAPWISGPLFLLYVVMAQAIWFAPFAAWLLLVSSAARNAPFLWALGIPAALMYLEWLLFRTQNLIDWIGGHVRDFGYYALNTDDDEVRFSSDDFEDIFDDFGDIEAPLSLLEIPDPIALLTAPGLWIGLVIAAVFTVGAVRLRRYHDV
ncbi:MAG: hypothetical protein AAF184_11320 [Pseudomonadota bacterium]